MTTGWPILIWACSLMGVPILLIVLACIWYWLHPDLPDNHDDPDTWGDQNHPRR